MTEQSDEEKALTLYVWDHYPHLLTQLEQDVSRAIQAEEKAQVASGQSMAKVLRDRFGIGNNPEALYALSNGVDAFRLQTRNRILRDHASEVMINRCPICDRIVRTPSAKQCIWCGNSWHGSDDK